MKCMRYILYSYFTMTMYREIGEVSAFQRTLQKGLQQSGGAECNVCSIEYKT